MSSSPQSPHGRNDPFTVRNFRVEIQGITSASFSEVQGLSESEVAEYRAGNMSNTSPVKLPGLNKFSNVTLKRGTTHDLSLWNWINGVLSGSANRASVVITLLDEADMPVLHWTLRNARPSKWSGPVRNAGSSGIAIEELELAHEGIDWGLIPRRFR